MKTWMCGFEKIQKHGLEFSFVVRFSAFLKINTLWVEEKKDDKKSEDDKKEKKKKGKFLKGYILRILGKQEVFQEHYYWRYKVLIRIIFENGRQAEDPGGAAQSYVEKYFYWKKFRFNTVGTNNWL